MAERLVDFAAAGRVAKRAELKDIRVTEVSASCDPSVSGPLEPTLEHECAVAGREANTLKITCHYRFAARGGGAPAANATVRYNLTYEIQGSEEIEESDLAEFAVANGTLHSWPFIREFLFGLTAKMGYPPFVVPAFHFRPKPRAPEVGKEQPVPARKAGRARAKR